MPDLKRNKTNGNAKRYKSKYAAKAPTSLIKTGTGARSIPRNVAYLGNGFPSRLNTTLRYYKAAVLTTGTAGTSLLYSANDPLVPSVGFSQRAQYFDQLMAVYNNFLVSGSKITVRLTHQTGGIQRCVLWTNDRFVTIPSFQGLMSQPNSASGTVTTNQASPLNLTIDYKARDLFGNDLFANAECQGTQLASPPKLETFFISVQDTVAGTMFVEVLIDYNTWFFDVKDVDIGT